MKFKVGDKVRIVKPCRECRYVNDCIDDGMFNNQIGIILKKAPKADEWTIEYKDERNNIKSRCHFSGEQLELVEEYKKVIKVFGVAKFFQEIERK